ncbi:sel1 repeat family protein [Oceanicoccus sp. KOV_DT_Chl]|uniref:sel1 repeat family protein n=1 Tax=Oceanicoccus sp. KOV_DT_Chl TaxID=1904639 RepID=UPI000C7C0FDF|nr:sel1 repeat family protein [Oceanicoccus sp. KOV_DT_Chl]
MRKFIVLIFLVLCGQVLAESALEQLIKQSPELKFHPVEADPKILKNIKLARTQALEKAALGDSQQMYNLYSLYKTGLIYAERDYKFSGMWLKMAAEYENRDALVTIGKAYRKGNATLGIPQSKKLALESFAKAKKMGSSEAAFYYEDIEVCGLSGRDGPDC